MQNAEKTKGSLYHISLEFLSCFQPLSHPRLARLTAPLDNGSRGCVLACITFICALELFQDDLRPFSHPRYARLTAPLDNGSQGLRSSLDCFICVLEFFQNDL